MASVRAMHYFLRRRYLLLSNTSLSTSKVFVRCISKSSSSDQKAILKSDKEQTGPVQVHIAEVGTLILFLSKTMTYSLVQAKVIIFLVKENTKSAWYMTVILAGIGVTAVMFYAIFKELFSSNSPNSIYSKAVDRCTQDPKVIDAIGQPIKAYGEETRRGRRGHVRYTTRIYKFINK